MGPMIYFFYFLFYLFRVANESFVISQNISSFREAFLYESVRISKVWTVYSLGQKSVIIYGIKEQN